MGEVPYNRRMEGLMLGASGHIYYSVDSPRLQQTLNPFTEIWQQVCKTSWYFDPCRMTSQVLRNAETVCKLEWQLVLVFKHIEDIKYHSENGKFFQNGISAYVHLGFNHFTVLFCPLGKNLPIDLN